MLNKPFFDPAVCEKTATRLNMNLKTNQTKPMFPFPPVQSQQMIKKRLWNSRCCLPPWHTRAYTKQLLSSFVLHLTSLFLIILYSEHESAVD